MTGGFGSPLAGQRVIVTRTRDGAAGIVNLLQAQGATVVVVPLITTEPVVSPDAIARALDALQAHPQPRWMVITSAVAARLVLGTVRPEALSAVSVAAVGPATAVALRDAGVRVDLIAAEPGAEALAGELAACGMAGAHVWFPAAAGAGASLPARLEAAGAEVARQVIYRTVMPAEAPARLGAALQQRVAAITLTSGSTARHLSQALGDRRLPEDLVVACIGPQTAGEAAMAGITVTLVAADHTVTGLVDALVRRLGPGQPVP